MRNDWPLSQLLGRTRIECHDAIFVNIDAGSLDDAAVERKLR